MHLKRLPSNVLLENIRGISGCATVNLTNKCKPPMGIREPFHNRRKLSLHLCIQPGFNVIVDSVQVMPVDSAASNRKVVNTHNAPHQSSSSIKNIR